MFPVLNVALMKPEKLSLHAQSAMTPPVSPVARRTRAERHQSVLVILICLALFVGGLERFSIECLKTKTKLITN